MLTKATSAVAKKCQNILLTMCDRGPTPASGWFQQGSNCIFVRRPIEQAQHAENCQLGAVAKPGLVRFHPSGVSVITELVAVPRGQWLPSALFCGPQREQPDGTLHLLPDRRRFLVLVGATLEGLSDIRHLSTNAQKDGYPERTHESPSPGDRKS
jgi:hypothetical protein